MKHKKIKNLLGTTPIDRVLNGAIVLLTIGFVATELVFFAARKSPDTSGLTLALLLVCSLLQGVPLFVCRAYPFPVLAVTILSGLVLNQVSYTPLPPIGILPALVGVTVYYPRRHS